ncbi:hypothetical protein JCM19301_839 [Jejuia pallidilutea]|uniref:Uncharacterized protein n=1 Tax=Jejuia pallidilutea TaxID=504487 RepID=A0A090WJC1_9FLAO|nr:hypothetical protein JCM19301_839 [Jejuia pallidilutea]GAL71359.1 hypothetical protein JCM19302_1037 [Jejuia pallidilutea]GAL89383.1 hypothetical protein JCM19538_1378 [Jejuia pallidilutea]
MKTCNFYLKTKDINKLREKFSFFAFWNGKTVKRVIFWQNIMYLLRSALWPKN